MSARLPWYIASVSIALFGLLFVRYTHESEAVRFDGDSTPGQDIVYFQQRNPFLGKIAGLASTIAVGYCVSQALKDEEEIEVRGAIAPSVKRSQPVQQRQIRPTTNKPVEEAYDEDPELDLPDEPVLMDEDEEEVAPFEEEQREMDFNPIDLIASADAKKRHVFLACQTQTGKTTTILSAIERKHQLTNGQCEWTISDPKQSFWMGLEDVIDGDRRSCVAHMDYNNPGDILKLKGKVDYLISKMTARQKTRNKAMQEGRAYTPKPHVFVIDEWPSTLKLAKDYDEEQADAAKAVKEPAPPSIRQYIIRKLETLILNGLEDGIFIWLVAQMPDLKQNGIDAGMRDQFGFWCQGRAGDFTSIEGALINNWIVKGRNKELTEELNQWIVKDRGIPIVYSNIGGHRMFEMNRLSDSIKSKRLFQPSTNVVELRRVKESAQKLVNSVIDPWED